MQKVLKEREMTIVRYCFGIGCPEKGLEEIGDLFNLPAAFITPLTIAIVPEISGAIAKGANAAARKTSEDAMRISAVISLPMGVGLTVLAYPIMNVLYPNSNAAGPVLLAIMGAASFFVCTVLMENAILQASGHEKLTMVTMISGGLVKIIVNWFLVAQRSINIYGAPVESEFASEG